MQFHSRDRRTVRTAEAFGPIKSDPSAIGLVH
jgi:hypothetical protein